MKSQSPQTGQFNSYCLDWRSIVNLYFFCLNPLKRVNSILTCLLGRDNLLWLSRYSLNPLKRVNSILTEVKDVLFSARYNVSIPSNGSIQFLHSCICPHTRQKSQVSIPSNGSIQFLLGSRIGSSGWIYEKSQSPQTGQFNSYAVNIFNDNGWIVWVSIPSNGSIQFLPELTELRKTQLKSRLNPLKRVNSILTIPV